MTLALKSYPSYTFTCGAHSIGTADPQVMRGLLMLQSSEEGGLSRTISSAHARLIAANWLGTRVTILPQGPLGRAGGGYSAVSPARGNAYATYQSIAGTAESEKVVLIPQWQTLDRVGDVHPEQVNQVMA